MNFEDILQGAGGIGAIAKQLGISPQEAERGAGALLPSILEGFGQKVSPAQGAGSDREMGELLETLGGGGLADNVVGPEPTETNKGNAILGQIFGSKEVSRDVAGNAAQGSGLDPALLKKMLPIVAMLVGGYLSSRSRGGNAVGGSGLGSILGPLLGGLAGGGGGGGLGGGLGGILGSVLGGRR